MEQTALEISREIAHKRIDEICQFEIDLIDIKGQELLSWNNKVSNKQRNDYLHQIKLNNHEETIS